MKNSLEKTLADTIKARKENFADLTFKKYQKELSVKNYEDKNDNEKLKNKNKRLDEKIEEVLQDENAKYILYLKEKCSDFIEKIKKGEKEYKNLIKYEGNSISGLEDEKIDIIEQQLLDYMVYKRDKEKLDEYNLKLGEKNRNQIPHAINQLKEIQDLHCQNINNYKKGVSNPAESNKTIFLFGLSLISGYLILKPSVLILAPDGKLIFESLDNINDFPLLLFPITPIFITGSFLNLL